MCSFISVLKQAFLFDTFVAEQIFVTENLSATQIMDTFLAQQISAYFLM